MIEDQDKKPDGKEGIIDTGMLNDPGNLKSCIESILFISGEAVKVDDMARTLELPASRIREAVNMLEQEYISKNRGFVLRKVAKGYRFYSNPAFNEILQKFVKTNIRVHISQAALETLAIIAYLQPITRTGIAEIRGVRADSVVLTLVDKGLVKDAGRLKEPGNPILYRTTERFLELLGLDSLKDLPPLKDFKKNEEQ
ncbi:MAG: SMC-Scp complex subunit ScpB [Actinobacteria bacterium]|nr:SMC-Scp complex subunit ScpB [Actinomycetota bacterium]